MEPQELLTAAHLQAFVRHIDERMGEMRTDLRDLRTEMREGFARVETRLTHLDTRLDHMDSRFGQLDSRLNHLDSRFERLDLGRSRQGPVLLLLLGVDIATVAGMGLALWLLLR